MEKALPGRIDLHKQLDERIKTSNAYIAEINNNINTLKKSKVYVSNISCPFCMQSISTVYMNEIISTKAEEVLRRMFFSTGNSISGFLDKFNMLDHCLCQCNR